MSYKLSGDVTVLLNTPTVYGIVATLIEEKTGQKVVIKSITTSYKGFEITVTSPEPLDKVDGEESL